MAVKRQVTWRKHSGANSKITTAHDNDEGHSSLQAPRFANSVWLVAGVRIAMHPFLLLLFSLLMATQAVAQVYPVNGSAALIPPYSVHLADYTSRSTERLMVNLVLNDMARPELRVRLRMKIEGAGIKLETKPEYIGSEIILQGGVPLRLGGADLLEYFDPTHLNFSGITPREFQRTGSLPQGFYQFCFEVLEYNRGVKISNTVCAPGWFILNDPPIVNLPRNNDKLKPTMPQNVIMQWTPRHTGSPNAAFTTEYEIKMVEVWPENRNPNDAILSSPPILETTTRNTTFIYGPAETPLEPGRRYAFRIRAKSIVGVEEYDLFKNQGYSEVFTFVYGDACNMPELVRAKPINPSKFAMNWQGQFNHTAYTVRYRQTGLANAQWFTVNTLFNDAEITSLKPNTTYEYQVAGGCGVFESDFTPVATVTTSPLPVADYACGLPVTPFTVDPSALMASLQVGDIIKAGDFDVELTRVKGANGTFSGDGIVVIPYLNNVKVKAVFTDIVINTDGRMVSGHMNVTGAAIDIVPDEVTALMGDLTDALDKIEEGLNRAEDVLGQIDAALTLVDQVLAEAMAYLPDDIIQQINDSKTQLASARDVLRNATTDEAKAAAREEVKTARQNLTNAAGRALQYYAQAVQQFVRIVIASLRELSQEYLGRKDADENALNQSEGDLDGFIASSNGTGNASSLELVHLFDDSYQLTDAEVTAKRNSDPAFGSYYDKTLDYLIKLRNYKLTQVLIALAVDVVNQESVDNFSGLLKQDGLDLLHDIAIQLKERKPEREIIDRTKEQIVTSLTHVMDVIISK